MGNKFSLEELEKSNVGHEKEGNVAIRKYQISVCSVGLLHIYGGTQAVKCTQYGTRNEVQQCDQKCGVVCDIKGMRLSLAINVCTDVLQCREYMPLVTSSAQQESQCHPMHLLMKR